LPFAVVVLLLSVSVVVCFCCCLFLLLSVSVVVCFLQLFVLAVILSAAKDPGTVGTTHADRTFSPRRFLRLGKRILQTSLFSGSAFSHP